MPEPATLPERHEAGQDVFATTHWSLVLAAGQSPSPEADAALEALCCAYWYPTYVYVRRKGHGPEDAKDLTQAFFAALLEKRLFRIADPAKGKFRSFLLGVLDHFLARQWTKAHRQKRGGGQVLQSLDETALEDRYRLEPAHEETPERAFERQWALALLETTFLRLQEECRQSDKADLFEQTKSLLSGEKAACSYREIGVRLGLNEGAVKVAVHRLRQRYGELLRGGDCANRRGPRRSRGGVAVPVPRPGAVNSGARIPVTFDARGSRSRW
jgi:RNA polymerase sigma-70 factor (ECF subfamily)